VSKFSYISIVCMAVLALSVRAQTPDPTKPLNLIAVVDGAAGSNEEAIKLTSILISSDRKVAIINSQVLHEGQTLKGVGAQIKKIDADAVTLQQNGKVWRVPLNSTTIRN
jgi:endonuclease/exonuclease/phosphatase (EEP) superfamily protein YafD